MPALARSTRSQRADIWPGFVDALATLLMVVIFLLMVFVLAQVFLSMTLSDRDAELKRLDDEISQLAEMLSIERRASQELRDTVGTLSLELQQATATRDELSQIVNQITLDLQASQQAREALGRELATARARAADADKVRAELEDAFKVISADKEKIELQLRKIAEMAQMVAALRQMQKDLEAELADERSATDKARVALTEEQALSRASKRQVLLLSAQVSALKNEIAKLNAALEASEKENKQKNVQIVDLGKRLNRALASKVAELARYRSEFFGRLRQILGDRSDIRIVGDRFVFQSEVLFASASAELGKVGQTQIQQLAVTLLEVAAKIPKEIDWVLRIDGHTDKIPIHTPQFPSNWELSTARAISVVQFLIAAGIPANRLAAAGFGEFQPLDARTDEIAYRRNRRIEIKLTQR
jgi:chemotaxis protein MotB